MAVLPVEAIASYLWHYLQHSASYHLAHGAETCDFDLLDHANPSNYSFLAVVFENLRSTLAPRIVVPLRTPLWQCFFVLKKSLVNRFHRFIRRQIHDCNKATKPSSTYPQILPIGSSAVYGLFVVVEVLVPLFGDRINTPNEERSGQNPVHCRPSNSFFRFEVLKNRCIVDLSCGWTGSIW